MKLQFTKKVFSFLFILPLLIGSVYSHSVQAEESAAQEIQSKPKQYYIVEVVLFRHMTGQGKTSEYWDDQFIENNEDENSSGYALAEYNLDNKQFSPIAGASALSAEHYKLLDSANHIRYSKDFKLLAHFGWTQRSLSKQRALPVQITANPYIDSLSPNGSLTLYVSRFLHLIVNLTATDCIYPKIPESSQLSSEDLEQAVENNTSLSANKELSDPAYTECVNKSLLFSQNRKMRSKELHYIDNPIFGLLVYVTPFKSKTGSNL